MAEQPLTEGKRNALGLPLWVWAVAIGLVALSVGFYSWIGVTRPEKANWWGVMGDSFAVFSALFNAGALLAALWAVHLQRKESHESGESTREQLKRMSEQVAQFARAADAQQALAESQKQLAEAQQEANREAAKLRLAQHSNTIAVLDAAHAVLDAAKFMSQPGAHSGKTAVENRQQALARRITDELSAEAKARDEVEKDAKG